MDGVRITTFIKYFFSQDGKRKRYGRKSEIAAWRLNHLCGTLGPCGNGSKRSGKGGSYINMLYAGAGFGSLIASMSLSALSRYCTDLMLLIASLVIGLVVRQEHLSAFHMLNFVLVLVAHSCLF